MKKRLDVQMKSATEIEITIFDVIGDGFFGGTSPQDIMDALQDAPKATQIDAFINSPGGSVFDATTIYNMLHQHKAHVTVHVDGLAASAASVVAMAGDEIIMAENAMMMIHDPWTITMGSAADIRKDADLLDKIEGTLVATYSARTGQTAKAVAAMMEAETWMNADEALEMGFATEIVEAKRAAAFAGMPARCKHIPQAALDAIEAGETLWTKAAAMLGLKDRPGGQPQRKESEMATPTEATPAAAAAPGLTAEQQEAAIAKGVQDGIAANTKRCADITAAIGDFPEVAAAAQADPAAGVIEAKALAFDAAQARIATLTGKLAVADKLVKAAAEAGLGKPADTGDEEGAPNAYEARFATLVAAGTKPDDARMAVAKEFPAEHKAWVHAQQPEKREMPV